MRIKYPESCCPPVPAFSCTSKQWQYCLRDLQLWQKCVFWSGTPVWETERLNEKESFEWKVWKPSLFLCQVSGVVPASLHIHLSLLPMRCLFQPLPASFCWPSNSNWRPLLTASRPLNTHCIFSLPAVSLYQLLLLLTLKYQDTHRQSAICCLCASLCSNFLPQSVFGGDFLTSQLIQICVDGFALSSFHLHAYISVCASAYSMPWDSLYLNPLKIHLLWCLTRNVLYSAFIVGLLRLNDKKNLAVSTSVGLSRGHFDKDNKIYIDLIKLMMVKLTSGACGWMQALFGVAHAQTVMTFCDTWIEKVEC